MKIVNLYKESYTVYIGRAGNGKDGYWGNPVIVGDYCVLCKKEHLDNGSTLYCYEKYLRNRLLNDITFLEKFKQLPKDAILGCFCKPKPCHGDIMIKVWGEICQ